MLRILMQNEYEPADATFKAAAALKTGMGVTKDYSAGTAGTTTTATSANIFLVDKEPIATGVYAAKSNYSDYSDQYTAVASGELMKLIHFGAGDEFGTDQYGTDIKASNVGKYVAFKDGKLCLATAASPYKLVKMISDGSHTLADVVVLDTTGTNS